MHHGKLQKILADIDTTVVSSSTTDTEHHVRAIYDFFIKRLGCESTKRSSGAGGPLDFERTEAAVAEETGRKNPFLVQTSATAATAYYISTDSLEACATLVGSAVRGGGGTYPRLEGRDATHPSVNHFVDAFTVDRVNAARIIAGVNLQLGLKIAEKSIATVERSWQHALTLAICHEHGRDGRPLPFHATSSPGFRADDFDAFRADDGDADGDARVTRMRQEARDSKTRFQKKKFFEKYQRRLPLHGQSDSGEPVREMEILADAEKSSTKTAKTLAISFASSLNEITAVADPVGYHVDTFNNRMKIGFENKAVFSLDAGYVRDGKEAEQVYTTKTLGGRLAFPDFGFCSYTRPNIDVEYHVGGHTLHGGSMPKFLHQGRGGGNRGQFCFALCDHTGKKKKTPWEERCAVYSAARRKRISH